MNLTFAEFCNDEQLAGGWFQGPTWAAWRPIDKVISGQTLNPDALAIFRELTDLEEPPTGPCTELWFVLGRRSGKTLKAAALGVYCATIGVEVYGWRDRLVKGERGVVQIVGVDRAQARVALQYCRAMLAQPLLAALVRRETDDGVLLEGNIALEIVTNDKRAARGRTVICAILDEVAFWGSENSANADEEVFAAISAARATIPNAMLVGISSPYARRGLLWRRYSKHYGKPGRVMVVNAASWVMNPNLSRDEGLIADAFEADPASAAAEFGASFRTDCESLLTREAVLACVDAGVLERPPSPNVQYAAHLDPSGGSADSYALTIAHKEKDVVVVDAIREARPPFNPTDVTAEFAALLKSYRVYSVHGDRYAGQWPREAMRAHLVDYYVSDANTSDLFLGMVPAINGKRVKLLDSPRLINQLISLERKTSRAGKDTIGHPPGPHHHDDIAATVAGVVHRLLTKADLYYVGPTSAPMVIPLDRDPRSEFGFY